MIPLIIVEGPTASGKTALAIDIAKYVGGEIVSADSMQIYKYMDIGSAKPSKEEMRAIPHHMIDITEPTVNYSLHDYVSAAHDVIKDIYSRGKIPVMAGGTGLYIDTVKNNILLSEEESDPKIKLELEDFLAENGAIALHEMLKKIDPTSAEKTHFNNTKRVLRALEVFYLTGKTMSNNQLISKTGEKIYDFIELGINYERKTLYERINRRVDIMFDMGLVNEVNTCLKLGCTRQNTSMQAIGYKEILDAFDGLCTLDEAKEKIKTESRRYAKRQLTWFKRSDILWLSPGESFEPAVSQFINSHKF